MKKENCNIAKLVNNIHDKTNKTNSLIRGTSFIIMRRILRDIYFVNNIIVTLGLIFKIIYHYSLYILPS